MRLGMTLWSFDVLGQTELLKHPDLPPRHVHLPPAMLVGGARRIMMMIVVPTFPDSQQRHQPVVSAFIRGLVVGITEHV